jgi:hypothetical protein
MKRTNTFDVAPPRTEREGELLRRVLDASASLWNELTYERRQQFFDGASVWDTADYRKQYVGVLGSATAQQVIERGSARVSATVRMRSRAVIVSVHDWTPARSRSDMALVSLSVVHASIRYNLCRSRAIESTRQRPRLRPSAGRRGVVDLVDR